MGVHTEMCSSEVPGCTSSLTQSCQLGLRPPAVCTHVMCQCCVACNGKGATNQHGWEDWGCPTRRHLRLALAAAQLQLAVGRHFDCGHP